MTENFQDGCNTIVAGCTTYGSTPTSNSPTNIVNAISVIYTNRYSAGRTQGQNDVKGNPNAYGLYTQAQYNAGYNSGVAAGQSIPKTAVFTVIQTNGRTTVFDRNIHAQPGGKVLLEIQQGEGTFGYLNISL